MVSILLLFLILNLEIENHIPLLIRVKNVAVYICFQKLITHGLNFQIKLTSL